jgi:hypothetical protein
MFVAPANVRTLVYSSRRLNQQSTTWRAIHRAGPRFISASFSLSKVKLDSRRYTAKNEEILSALIRIYQRPQSF